MVREQRKKEVNRSCKYEINQGNKTNQNNYLEPARLENQMIKTKEACSQEQTDNQDKPNPDLPQTSNNLNNTSYQKDPNLNWPEPETTQPNLNPPHPVQLPPPISSK